MPDKGGEPALAGSVGGQVRLMLENIPGTLPFVNAGKLRALAVSSEKRLPMVHDLPTLDEAWLKSCEIVGWNKLFFPAGTQPAIVKTIHAQTVKMLVQPDVKERHSAP